MEAWMDGWMEREGRGRLADVVGRFAPSLRKS
jgi:hypothetical protein